MENRQVPEIRFLKFQDDWEQRKLGDISDIKTGPFGSTLHAEDYVSDGTPIITTEHFKNGYLVTNKKGLPQVSSEDYIRLKSYLLLEDDIVFSRVGSVDINALILKNHSGWLFSGRVLRVRTPQNIDSQYLHYELSTTRIKNNIVSRAVGQTMPSINTEILKVTPILLPKELVEQQKIGSFFKQLDDTIALQQQELNTLKQTKKGFLQKMFPKNGEKNPEFRFNGFTDDWEQRKLGDYVNFLNGRAYKQTELLDSGKYRVLRVGNFNTNDRWYYSNLELEDNKYADKGDLLYLWATNFGPEIWTQEKVIYHYHIWKLDILDSQLDKQYLYTWLETDKEQIKQNTNGTTMVHVTKGNMEEREFQFPCFEEQQKIGSFFKQLDDTIALHQRELDALKETKKAFLQKMFI